VIVPLGGDVARVVLELMSLTSRRQQDMYTKQGVAVTVDSGRADQGEIG